MTLPFHPLACAFPLIEGEEFTSLVNDIKANGLIDSIDVFEGAVLDGRNRQRACEAAEVPCRYRDFPGDQAAALTYVVAKNLNRRHLNDGQRAFVAARLAGFGWGGDRSKLPDGDLKTDAAARLMNAKKRSVDRARVVRDRGIDALQAMLERGLLPVATAEQVAELSEEDQRAVMLVNDPRRVCAELKKRMRAKREAELAGKQTDLPKKKFGVILADPEWRFEPYSRDSGMDRAADNHYSTSATEVIAARPVADIAADDCVLFLWATVPMLQEALFVMEAWGFACLDTPRLREMERLLASALEDYINDQGEPADDVHWVIQAKLLLGNKPKGRYVSHFAWGKDRIGTGYWNRNKHELLLIGVRGHPPAPAMGTQWDSLIEAAVGKHSAKPEAFLEMIEAYFPNLPKIELNRRGPVRKGWSAWGNEAQPGEFDPTTGEISDDVRSGNPGGPDDRRDSRCDSGCAPDVLGDLRPVQVGVLTEVEDIPKFLRRQPDNTVADVKGETITVIQRGKVTISEPVVEEARAG